MYVQLTIPSLLYQTRRKNPLVNKGLNNLFQDIFFLLKTLTMGPDKLFDYSLSLLTCLFVFEVQGKIQCWLASRPSNSIFVILEFSFDKKKKKILLNLRSILFIVASSP